MGNDAKIPSKKVGNLKKHAQRYVNLDYKLVALQPKSKKPEGLGWGKVALDPADLLTGQGIGINHPLSRTVGIDFDNPELCQKALEQYSFDIFNLPGNPPIFKGNPERFKALYRLPDGVVAPRGVVKLNLDDKPVLEIRGGPEGLQVMDVLPPSIHPDTGKPYFWDIEDKLPKRDDLPELPQVFLDIWANFGAHEPVLLKALGVEPPAQRNTEAARTSVSYDSQSPIDDYNRANRVEDVLARNGYERQGRKYLSPSSSTGNAGVVILDDVCYSHHGDALGDGKTHDAFDVMRILECNGVWKDAYQSVGTKSSDRTDTMPPLDRVDTEHEWIEPTPLSTALLPVQSLHKNMLPDAISAYVWQVAEQMNHSAPDYAAIGYLICAASLIGGKATIQPKKNDTSWVQPATFWGIGVGEPSSGKSPGIRSATRFMNDIQTALAKTYLREMEVYTTDMEIHKSIEKALYEKLKAITKNNKNQFQKLSEAEEIKDEIKTHREDKPAKPRERKVIVNSATKERIQMFMVDNPHGFLLSRDEISGWLRDLQQEKNAEDAAFFLECHDGLGNAMEMARVTRDDERATSTIMSIMGTTQPSVITPLLQDRASFKSHNGFWERFQMIVYPDQQTSASDIITDEGLVQQAREIMERLANIPEPNDGKAQPHVFAPDAQKIFTAWYNDFIDSIAKQPPLIQSVFGKQPALVARLALVFHILDGDFGKPVTETALLRALAWREYLETHTKRLHALGSPPNFAAASLLKKLPFLGSSFTASTIRNKNWEGLKEKENRQLALATLIEHHYIHEVEVSTSGRAAKYYYVNPFFEHNDTG